MWELRTTSAARRSSRFRRHTQSRRHTTIWGYEKARYLLPDSLKDHFNELEQAPNKFQGEKTYTGPGDVYAYSGRGAEQIP